MLVPTTALSAGVQPGLKAEYFANRNLEGAPMLTRVDRVVDSNWNRAAACAWRFQLLDPRTGKLTTTVSGRTRSRSLG